MKTKLLQLFSISLVLLGLMSCVKDKTNIELIYYTPEDMKVLNETLNLPEEPHNYAVNLPKHFFLNSFSHFPPISSAKATLGRVLFYDNKLSANDAVSCASCHFQEKAFADPVALSEGFEGEVTRRNSFALGAVANFTSSYGDASFNNGGTLFWDNRASSVAEQSRQTLQDPIEMGMKLNVLASKLRPIPYYRILSKKAYGTEELNEELILDAISEFINSLATFESKFDKAMGKRLSLLGPFEDFSEQENLGKELYISQCSSCHGMDMVRTEQKVANNGLDLEYDDKGIGELSKRASDNGVFKVPLLRNIELTGPYMHDGRFETLEEVIDHYNSGIQNHPNLDSKLSDGGTFSNAPIRLNLNNEEKAALVAFLKTLTDEEFISKEKYSDPFIK